MRQNSILGELGWLLYFVVLLVVAVYVLNVAVNALFPRHFNNTVADVLAGVIAALIFIATRAYAQRRPR